MGEAERKRERLREKRENEGGGGGEKLTPLPPFHLKIRLTQIAGLLESVRSARYGKLRDGIGQLTGPMAVKLTNITASELNAVRPFFLGALTAFAAVAAPPGGSAAAQAAEAAAAPAAAATAPPPPASQSQQPASQSQQPGGRFRTRNR